MNKDKIKDHSNIILGGYKAGNLSDNNIFFASKDTTKKIKLTFSIFDIIIVDNSEIIKLLLGNNLVCRILKFTSEESNLPGLTFDLVDENNKTIVFKANKVFHNGVGLGLFLFEYNQITQWEITVIDMICRSFIFGDKISFLKNIETYNIKLSQSADWFVKNKLE